MAVPLRKLRLHALMTMTTGFNENGTDMIRANAVEQGSCARCPTKFKAFQGLFEAKEDVVSMCGK